MTTLVLRSAVGGLGCVSVCLALTVGLFGNSPEPNFEFGMRPDLRYTSFRKKYPTEWGRVRTLFECYRKSRAAPRQNKKTYRIPKKIHLIWLGSAPPPFVRQMVETWKCHHPTWTVKLWTDEDIRQFHLRNREAFLAAKNYGEKSDIARYEILDREGGIHVDVDFECLRSFDDLCQSLDFFTGVGYSEGAPFVYNGLIGTRPGHPIIRRCVQMLQTGNGDNSFQRILCSTGPHFFTHCFNSVMWPDGTEGRPSDVGSVVAFPVLYFYPFPDSRRGDFWDTDVIKRTFVHPVTRAVHYWKISWQEPQNLR